MLSTAHLLVSLLSCLVLSTVGATGSSGDEQASTVPVSAFLDDATFVGSTDGLTNKFLGIPYAQPPYVVPSTHQPIICSIRDFSHSVGELRFRRPQPIGRYTGTHSALEFGPWCPQHYIAPPGPLPVAIDEDVGSKIVNAVFNPFASQSEDCM